MTKMAGKKKIGRPKIKIDIEQLEKLTSIGCTDEEIGVVLNISHDTIWRRKNEDPSFREAYEKGWTNLKTSLRRAQLKKAFDGNPAMLIWLGKQILGQRDKQDLEVKAEIEGMSRQRIIDGAIEELRQEGYKVEGPK